MGPEVALALMAGGTGAQIIGAKQQQREQRNILNRAFDKTQKVAQQGNADVLGQGAKETGAAQMADMGTAADAIEARTGADLKGAGADLIDAAGDKGAQSQAFLTAKADRALTEGNRQTAIARELAKVRSTGEVQTNNAISRGGLMEELASRGNTNRAQTQAATLDAQSVQAPWYSDLGKIASMVGMVGGMNPAAMAGGAGELSLAPALLGDAGTAGSTALGAVKFGDGAMRAATLGGAGAGASPLAAALARIAPAAGMFGQKSSMFGGRL